MTTLRHLSALALALATSLPGTGWAADKDGNFALRGFGAQTCGEALQAIRSEPDAAATATAWLLGYSTAINRIQSETFDASPLTDGRAFYQMVVGICEELPESRVETVVFDVLRTLAAARVTQNSPVVRTVSDGNVATVRREILKKMQQALADRGYLSGNADGVYGVKTEAALKAFQAAQGLPVTGVAGSATVVRLLIELPSTAGE